MELETRLELATYGLQDRCATDCATPADPNDAQHQHAARRHIEQTIAYQYGLPNHQTAGAADKVIGAM